MWSVFTPASNYAVENSVWYEWIQVCFGLEPVLTIPVLDTSSQSQTPVPDYKYFVYTLQIEDLKEL
jgi:hypothetical protein